MFLREKKDESLHVVVRCGSTATSPPLRENIRAIDALSVKRVERRVGVNMYFEANKNHQVQIWKSIVTNEE